jgi:hypothetical protein
MRVQTWKRVQLRTSGYVRRQSHPGRQPGEQQRCAGRQYMSGGTRVMPWNLRHGELEKQVSVIPNLLLHPRPEDGLPVVWFQPGS